MKTTVFIENTIEISKTIKKYWGESVNIQIVTAKENYKGPKMPTIITAEKNENICNYNELLTGDTPTAQSEPDDICEEYISEDNLWLVLLVLSPGKNILVLKIGSEERSGGSQIGAIHRAPHLLRICRVNFRRIHPSDETFARDDFVQKISFPIY